MGYFTDEDFDTFRSEYVETRTKDIMDRRKIIQSKLLEINDDLKKTVRSKYNLHPHWKDENVTSLLFPCEYNHGKVTWIGLRYGRSKREIALLNEGRNLNDLYLGFQKYNCFQIDLSLDGLDMGIYHSVPHDAVDRMYVQEYIDDLKFRTDLGHCLNSLIGYGYVFSVGRLGAVSNSWETINFEFDRYIEGNILEEFVKFYKENVTDGVHSSLLYHYSRYDERIQTIEDIEKEYLKHIDRLFEFYRTISWSVRV